MKTIKVVLMFAPWILLLLALFLWSLGYDLPGKSGKYKSEVIQKTIILEKVEQLGKLELVRYNFKEVYDYQALSQGKSLRSSALKSYDYTPDLAAILIASGEAVGCIDLNKLKEENIEFTTDTLFLTLPAPELCYHKLDLEKTRIFEIKRGGWWSRLFSDDEEMKSVIEYAYQEAEEQIKQSALEMGILDQTIINGELMLKPLFEELSGKVVVFTYLPREYDHMSDQ